MSNRTFEYSVLKALGLEGCPGIQKIEVTIEVGRPVEIVITRQIARPDPIEVVSAYWLQEIPACENEEPKPATT